MMKVKNRTTYHRAQPAIDAAQQGCCTQKVRLTLQKIIPYRKCRYTEFCVVLFLSHKISAIEDEKRQEMR